MSIGFEDAGNGDGDRVIDEDEMESLVGGGGLWEVVAVGWLRWESSAGGASG